jgi:hypothetical protein
MAKKPRSQSEDPEQSRRFLETARELGADGELDLTGEAFERAFQRVIPERRKPAPKDKKP